MKFTRIPKGQIFVATSGVHDSYWILGAFVANMDIDLEEVMPEFYQTYPDIGEDFYVDRYQLLKWLCVSKGMCDEVTLMEFHIEEDTVVQGGDDAYFERINFASDSRYWKEAK